MVSLAPQRSYSSSPSSSTMTLGRKVGTCMRTVVSSSSKSSAGGYLSAMSSDFMLEPPMLESTGS